MLTYNVSSEFLYGTVDSQCLSMKAYSGGGRGSTAGAERADVVHWDSQKKAPSKFDFADRGGPIPKGYYVVRYLGKYKHFGLAARLEQTITSLIFADVSSDFGISVTERDGFLIHGAGPKGSDGCIVPDTKDSLNQLMTALKSSKGPTYLKVTGEGIDSSKLRNVGSVA